MTCRLHTIFAAQRELMPKFYEIEKTNGCLETPDVPVDINTRVGQARLRNYGWRITEEIAEALNVIRDEEKTPPSQYFREEVSDALHFLTEFTILCGFKPADLLFHKEEDVLSAMYALRKDAVHNEFWWCWSNFICDLGMTINMLKLRPWKQKHVETDPPRFRFAVAQMWLSFCAACICSGISSDELVESYHNKHAVNVKRQSDGV